MQRIEERQEAVCPTCETRVKRCANDFPTNLYPPYKEVLLFGMGGKQGTVVQSRQEMDKALNRGWKDDMNWDGDRTAVSLEEYDKMMGFDTEELDR
jgi:hypothetical protein